jgi:ATP-dependent DNA ligase
LVFTVRRLAAEGLEAWKQVIERGCEGYVAKDERSAYEGGATRRWLNVKQRDWSSRRILRSALALSRQSRTAQVECQIVDLVPSTPRQRVERRRGGRSG